MSPKDSSPQMHHELPFVCVVGMTMISCGLGGGVSGTDATFGRCEAECGIGDRGGVGKADVLLRIDRSFARCVTGCLIFGGPAGCNGISMAGTARSEKKKKKSF